MSDGDDVRERVARVEGRVDGLERGLGRQEQACERRASGHLDITLYRSERDNLRDDLTDLKTAVATARNELQVFQKQLTDQRRWVIGVVIIPIVGFVVVVLMGVLS